MLCRIALYASVKELKNFKEFLRCFRLGSVSDFILNTYRKGHRSHMHGWGFAYIYSVSNDMGCMYFRTSIPIAFDNSMAVTATPRYFDWILMVLHSRLTFEEPVDVMNSHPHHFSRVGEFSIWLAHNGSVDKEKIAKELGLTDIVRRYSDSYFLTQWIGRNMGGLNSKDIVDTIRSIVDLGVVRTSLNLVAIILDEIKRRVIGLALNFVAEESMDMLEYYRLYKVGIGNESVAIASSTIAAYLNKLYGISIEPLDNSTIVFVYPRKEGIDLEIGKIH